MTQNALISDFLKTHGAISAEGVPLRFASIEQEIALVQAKKAAVCWLESYVAVDFVGEDARAFLQGQLSNDVFALNDEQAQWQGYCQPQGRLLATPGLARVSAQHFWMWLPASIAAAIAKRLTMFVLRSKVKVSVSDDALMGFVNGARDGALRIDAARQILRVPAAQFAAFWKEDLANFAPISVQRWQWVGLENGLADVHAGAHDTFIPQTIGWDTVAVNYKKGCYPGQEVVARAHYRGAVKRKPSLLRGTGPTPAPGQELLVGEEPVGNVVLASETDSLGGWLALASLLTESRIAGKREFDGLGNVSVTPIGEP